MMLKTIAATLISMTITVTATAQSSDPLPDGAGKPLVQRMCGGCHNLRVVTSQRATHDRWETIVQQMVARGVDATDEEIETMVDYLAKNYPPTAKATAPPQTPSSSPHRATDRHPTVSLIGDRSWMTARQCDIDALFRFWSRSALRTKTTPQSHQKTDTLSKAYRSRRSRTTSGMSLWPLRRSTPRSIHRRTQPGTYRMVQPDISTIRAWLGHVSIDTTKFYAEVDLQRRAEVLAHSNAFSTTPTTNKRWQDDPSLLAALGSL
jgi:hypothetical protein